MTRPHCVSLSDRQLRLVQHHAAALPPALRDRFLCAVSDRLSAQPSDEAVAQVVNLALDGVFAFRNGTPN